MHIIMLTFFAPYSNKKVGGWDNDGIIQDSIATPGHTVYCNATHLTSFAVLVAGSQKPVNMM